MRTAIAATDGLSISQPGFRKAYKIWLEQQPKDKSHEVELWGANLARVSALVVEERKKKKSGGLRTTMQIIKGESSWPHLRANTVNKHIQKGLAGKAPCDRKKPTILTEKGQLRVLTTVAAESDKVNPLSCAEVQGLMQEMVQDTTVQDKFRNDNVSRQYAHVFRKRWEVR